MAKVTMPQLGESVAEGTIGKWLKQPGDTVEKYEPLLEVITDKVNAEVPSPFAGVLKEILAEEGATVPNNAEIAVIETSEDAPVTADAPAAPGAETPTPTPTATHASAPTAAGTPAATGPGTQGTPAGSPAPVALEKEAGAEPDGGVEVEVRDPAALAGSANGPAGSDERPERATEPAPTPAGSSPAPAPAVAATAAASAPMPTATATELGDAPGNPDARMTPAVRRLLREHGLTAAQIVGTGGGGRITREDVTNYVETQRTGQAVGGQTVGGQGAPSPTVAPAASAPGTAPAGASPASQNGLSGSSPALQAPASAPDGATPSAAVPVTPISAPASATAPAAASSAGSGIEFPAGTDEVLVPMTQMRKGIAAQMTRALQAPHAYVQMEIDATRLVAFREANKKAYQAKEGIGLSFVPFVVKASAAALKKIPTFNAHWTEQGLLAKRRINVGVAVAVDDGLIVPVVRDADQLSIHGLNVAIADVAARAKANKLRLDDFGGGTFTVDNTGYLGTNLVMPILNVPEVGIVTMEAITKRPVVVGTPDGDVIAIRPVMNMVLGVDHRANDGAGGAALLREIKSWLENVGPDTAIY